MNIAAGGVPETTVRVRNYLPRKPVRTTSDALGDAMC
jgi:hypothetical protein